MVNVFVVQSGWFRMSVTKNMNDTLLVANIILLEITLLENAHKPYLLSRVMVYIQNFYTHVIKMPWPRKMKIQASLFTLVLNENVLLSVHKYSKECYSRSQTYVIISTSWINPKLIEPRNHCTEALNKAVSQNAYWHYERHNIFFHKCTMVKSNQ